MNKEEKKATENLKLFLYKDKNEDNYLTDENLRTILNLIEKQSKVIDKIIERINDETLGDKICDEIRCDSSPIKCKECIKHYFYRKVEEDE